MVTKELIEQFKEFTGSDNDDVARQTLEACDSNLETAVQLHFANDANVGNNDQLNHAVQVDDDIEIIDETVRQENPIVIEDSTDENEDEDGVRRPIASVRDQVIGESYHQYYTRQSRRNAPNPIFEQFELTSETGGRRRIAHNGASNNENGSGSSRDLAAIFRPPTDIISRYDWDSLRKAACKENRWILVNIQDPNEFACQTLNRDCWSDETLKEIIKANFLFWQVYAESSDGRRIVGYYSLKKFPAIFIIDPRTSEKVHDVTSDKPNQMITELSDFYDRYPSFSAFDTELRAKMTPMLSKPATSGIDFDLDDEEPTPSNGMEVEQPSTSSFNREVADKSDLPSTSSAGNSLGPISKNPSGPIEQPSAESLRERREKFLRQFE